MNNTYKILKDFMYASVVIMAVYTLNACSTQKYGYKVEKVKNWVNWELQFKENIGDSERANSLIFIDKYIVDYLQKSGTKVAFIHIDHKIDKKKSISLGLIIRVDIGIGMTHGGRGPKPPPPPPTMEQIPNFNDRLSRNPFNFIKPTSNQKLTQSS